LTFAAFGGESTLENGEDDMLKLLNAIVIALLLPIGVPVFAADKPAPAAVAPMSVNINTADAQTLAAALDGVGAARAKAIVEYRDSHGPFRSVDDLAQVKGIGERVVDANRGHITVK
jgi:competence protein ComEA